MVLSRTLRAVISSTSRILNQQHMAFGFVPHLDLNLNLTYCSSEAVEDRTASRQIHTQKVCSTSMAGSSSAKMAAISEVEIDAEGRFKYILLKLWAPDHKDEDDFKYLVRGNKEADWHNDIFEEVSSRVSPLGLEVECVGGGRILHEPQKKKISVFGYSQGYGKADHSISCNLLKKKYPQYDNIDWSDEGY